MTEPIRYARPRALVGMSVDDHHVIEASAGTGKTYLIEHRIVDLLLLSDTPLERILVVTFTEKATAELRRRVRALIEKVADAAEHTAEPDEPHWLIDAAARRALSEALFAFDRAPIHTIHGFCHGVLTDNAFANRRLFEQTQVAGEVAFGDAFRSALRERFARDEADQPFLAAWLSAHSVTDLERLLYKCSQQTGRLAPAYDPDTLAAALGAADAVLPQFDDDTFITKSLRAAGIRGSSPKYVARRLADLRAAVSAWVRDGAPVQFLADTEVVDKQYGATGLFPFLRKHLDATDGSVPAIATIAAAVRDLDEARVPLAAAVAQRFLPAVVARMRADKDRAGLFDFHDMLRLVWDSLQGERGAELVDRLRARYRFALIDEFQDTDDLQWKIFRRLFLEAPGDNRLCIIGDPKQAIYSFRGADVFTYIDARAEVAGAGGGLTHLTDNYRSTAALVSAYNLLIAEHLDRYFSGDIRYDHPVSAATDIVATGAGGETVAPVCVFHVTGTDKKLKADDVRTALISRITAEIRGLLFDPAKAIYVGTDTERARVDAGDIFVLTRTIAESNDIAASLRRAGVPCAIYKQEGLFQTREAEEVADLLTAVADPRDRSARFRAWHTRFFGLDLADLPGLTDLPDNHPLLTRLYGWKAAADRLDYEQLFSAIVADSRLIERELVLDRSERALTNFLHLFELLLENVMHSRCELHELIGRLRGWIANTPGSTLDDRNVQRLESERNAVQIMTIHRAKGLEAHVVFVYGGLSRSNFGDVHVYHDGSERVVHVGPPSGPARAAVDAESDGEDQRLLYVALTRAAARLYLPYVSPADMRVNGAYRPINRRLEPIVAGRIAGTDAAAYFAVEQLRAGGPELRALPAPIDLGAWRPPDALVDEPAIDAAYEDIRRTRGGFVITSYTRMKARAAGDAPMEADDFKADIELVSDALDPASLPGGAESGIFLHEVLEHLPYDLTAAAADFDAWREHADIAALFGGAMARHNRDPRHLLHSQRMVYDCVTSPIAAGPARIPSLVACARNRRELEFLYPVGDGSRGFVKGFIDLVFEHDGRVYALDYKSDVLDSYHPEALERHVAEHYQLQADLYSIALAKMLRVETPADHEARFGGLVYSFLRAGTAGHIFARPGLERLVAVERALGTKELA